MSWMISRASAVVDVRKHMVIRNRRIIKAFVFMIAPARKAVNLS